MNVNILVELDDKFVVHYKKRNGFSIIGFRYIEQAKDFNDRITAYQPRIDKIDTYVKLENIIFDYFNEMRGKVWSIKF